MMNGSTSKSKKKFKKYIETHENENNSPKTWDAAKVARRGNCIAMQAYLKKTTKISNKKTFIYI